MLFYRFWRSPISTILDTNFMMYSYSYSFVINKFKISICNISFKSRISSSLRFFIISSLPRLIYFIHTVLTLNPMQVVPNGKYVHDELTLIQEVFQLLSSWSTHSNIAISSIQCSSSLRCLSRLLNSTR